MTLTVYVPPALVVPALAWVSFLIIKTLIELVTG